MTQTEQVNAFCFRPEVDGDLIANRKVNTVEDYVVVNFEVASSRSFRDIPPKSFRDA